MREIEFNYFIPKEYIDRYTGEKRYALCKSGEKMNLGTLSDIKAYADENLSKDAHPWVQLFDSGYRVDTQNIDWKYWTGCVYIDIDSKHYYYEVRKFNSDNLLKSL